MTCNAPSLSALPALQTQNFLRWLASLLIAVAFVGTGNVVHASTLSAADEKSVRTVIEGQLAALAKDDAVKAFSYAAPNVRDAVGSAGKFLSMLQTDYPVVYRPASVAFLKPEGKDGVAVQRVQMMDASGESWLAIYSLAQQKDKSWRITGCAVVHNKGRMA